MRTRIISSIIAFPVVAFIIAIGGLPLKILMLAISLIGMKEIYSALNNGKPRAESILGYAALLCYYFLLGRGSDFIVMLFGVFIIANLMLFVRNHKIISPMNCAFNIFGFFYVGLLLSYVYLTRAHAYGAYFVWLIFISAWACDTFAYFTGMLIGKRKLAPILSPKKTIEGAVGGTLGAALVGGVFAYVASVHFSDLFGITDMGSEINLITLSAVIGGAGAVFAQFGDLSASAIKRHTGIKDYGKLIPGHGGIIDRFDSVIFTAPIVYAVIWVLT